MKLPRFLQFRPRIYRDFYDFDREITAIFSILPYRGTAIFGFKNRDKFLPLDDLEQDKACYGKYT